MKKAEELILLYHFADEEKAKITAVLERMKIKSKEITAEMVQQKVGYLAGLKGFKETAGIDAIEPFDQAVLLMQGISSKRMNELLTNFKAEGLQQVSLKAVVTPYNRFWSFARLCQAIQKENKLMRT